MPPSHMNIGRQPCILNVSQRIERVQRNCGSIYYYCNLPDIVSHYFHFHQTRKLPQQNLQCTASVQGLLPN